VRTTVKRQSTDGTGVHRCTTGVHNETLNNASLLNVVYRDEAEVFVFG